MVKTIVVCVALAGIATLPLQAVAQQDPLAPAAGSPAPAAAGSDKPADLQTAVAADTRTDAEKAEARRAAMEAFEKKLVHRTGKIELAAAQATLNVPDGFYYLDPKDSESVLVDAWGNPPGDPSLGMLFQKDTSPLDGKSWGVVIQYEDTGYVSDLDATKINYDDLLKQMRNEQQSENIERAKKNFQQITIVGWAAPPRYDRRTHKLYWAKDLKFGAEPEDTLNYDMRVLGRKGVLSLNFVAAMGQVKEIETASPTVLAIPEFNAGARYEDFNASTDAKSNIGLTGLILGGGAGGALLAKKAGLIGVALLFLKKLWIVVLGGFAAIGGAIKRFFGGSKAKPGKAGVTQPAARSADSIFDPPPAADPPPTPPAKPPTPDGDIGV